jgi:arylsulfatase A-like enzyme
VIYASDNGPWLSFKHHGGSAGPLRDGKGTTFEGGQRVPCLIRGPGIPAGTVCDALTGTIDVLPTLVTLTGGELPPDRRIDGLDVSGLWRGEIEASPREAFLYYTSHGEIEGIREGSWKLLVKRPPRGKQAAPGAAAPESQVMLFDLERDLGERTNVAGEHPDLVARLRVRMQELDREITANARPQWSRDAAVASP